MRILCFLDTDHLSGPARLAMDAGVEMQKQGHELLMVGLVRSPAPLESSAFADAMRAAGLPTQLLHERHAFDFSIFGQFRQILDQFNPHLYQSHGYKGSLLGRTVRRRGISWQAIFHGFTWENWKVRFYHWLDVNWLRGADEVVVVSRAFGNHLAERGIPREKIRWIPNAISPEHLEATDSGRDLRAEWIGPDAARPIEVPMELEDLLVDTDQSTESPQPILAGMVGRLSPEKNPEGFIRAFDQAAARCPNLYGVVVGDGPLMERCQSIAAEIVHRDRLRLAGFREDLAAVYRALDMLVISSRSEGMPTVMIEAMLSRVPVISTRVGAVPDILEDGVTGLLTSIDNDAALAEAMIRLSEDAAFRFRLTEQALELAEKRLTVHWRTGILLEHARCLVEDRPLPEVPWDLDETQTELSTGEGFSDDPPLVDQST